MFKIVYTKQTKDEMLTLATISGTLLVTRIMTGIGFESQFIPPHFFFFFVPVPYYLFSNVHFFKSYLFLIGR